MFLAMAGNLFRNHIVNTRTSRFLFYWDFACTLPIGWVIYETLMCRSSSWWCHGTVNWASWRSCGWLIVRSTLCLVAAFGWSFPTSALEVGYFSFICPFVRDIPPKLVNLTQFCMTSVLSCKLLTLRVLLLVLKMQLIVLSLFVDHSSISNWCGHSALIAISLTKHHGRV